MYYHRRCRSKILLGYGPIVKSLIIRQNVKSLQKNEKNVLKIRRIGTFPLNLALFYFTVSKKTSFVDRRTKDARAMTVALLCSNTKQS